MVSWSEMLDSVEDSQRYMLQGSSLSQRFSAWPTAVSHPAIVGGFYGLLISVALLLPYGLRHDWVLDSWFQEFATRSVMIILGLALLGHVSLLMNKMFQRPPISPPRIIFYVMPFVGLGMLLSIWTGLSNLVPEILAWAIIMFPGPAYVHMSWAPRYRMITIFEEGGNPFGPADALSSQREKEQELEAAISALDD